ncbi:MAG: hypothetical protein VXW65_13360, partial [Pseudomonadota bacterium]|nr:hypothetical protein [Pseudomonadota bacterium]
MKTALFSAVLAASISSAYAVNLSPNQIGGGDIPNTHAQITFNLSNGNWAPTLTLPQTATDGATITIQSSAGYASNLITTNTDYPLGSLTIRDGETLSFTYRAANQRWIISTTTYTPNTHGANIPDLTGLKVVRYQIQDGNWTSSVNLPQSAAENTVVLVSSTATWDASINPEHVLHASTLRLKSGDTYALLYRNDLQRWVPVTTPVRQLRAQDLGGVIAVPTSPKTEVSFGDGNWIPQVALPSSAGDRDRITIQSSATWAATISNANIDFSGSLQLVKGSRYEFMFIQEKNQWILQSHTRQQLTPNQIHNGQLPNITVPVIELTATDGNWASRLSLPINAKVGDQVIVRNQATLGMDVSARDADFSTTRLNTGDVVRF